MSAYFVLTCFFIFSDFTPLQQELTYFRLNVFKLELLNGNTGKLINELPEVLKLIKKDCKEFPALPTKFKKSNYEKKLQF